MHTFVQLSIQSGVKESSWLHFVGEISTPMMVYVAIYNHTIARHPTSELMQMIFSS